MIKVGVIGCGRIAQTRHLPEYAENKNVQILAVYDFNAERAAEIANLYGAKSYESVEQLLADTEIDAVSVCVRNADHCKVSVAALESGKHVLCEKPMAITLEECNMMVETAKKCNKYLMIGHNQRIAKAHSKAKNLLNSGAIGELLTFKTNFSHGGPETWTIDASTVWFFDKKLSALGAMADLGVHKTDLIQFLTGHKVAEVTSYIGTLDKRDKDGNLIGVDDNAICIYQMENGVVGTMTSSWTNYGPEENSTTLYGTEGVMCIYCDPEFSIKIYHRDGTKTFFELDQIQTNDNQTKSGVIDLWVDCLINDRQPEISGEEALSTMKVVFAAIESAETGKKVKIV